MVNAKHWDKMETRKRLDQFMTDNDLSEQMVLDILKEHLSQDGLYNRWKKLPIQESRGRCPGQLS